ncbi:(d)CMP kinase [Leptotrichia buccalis]|uniref:Cytidylate kinase n=1 Tax=Leptotrichia buccalis (strain ATCC 14201 / DSM 1135 / JCM 12969 / NCTC 10249 / C-1013-b) TaxID=523794 RepID=C7N8X1_LEPBD|nr:(d)CMP kinase [Leptotrichia buccalis]ACV38602.1 cytidylate kinase [Leptotrichia buccalis C-1013-b]
MIIAIDGPAGSGKSTIAKLIAEDLGLVYLDTGAMYRLVTLKALNEGILGDFEKIKKMLDNLNIDIKENGFYLDNVDVSDEIRKPIVSENVSDIAAIREVREKMVDLQRKFSESKNVILDGRDIGTVVFPNANVKIFLVADAKERANRRYKELVKKGENVKIEEIYENILKRDEIDSTRKESPLKKAEDAIEVDTTSKNIEEVKNEILNIYSKYFICV